MSDNIPFEIQVEIIKCLPVKSLIRFRSVSKAWKSLIDSSPFISHYRSQQQHLLVRYDADLVDKFERKYVSVVDDDTFPQQRVPVTVHLLVKMLTSSSMIGSSHGLLCLYGRHLIGRNGHIPGRDIAVVWNFSIRKAIAVVVPNVEQAVYATVLGFEVCRETADPKIIKITCHYKNRRSNIESISSIPCQVEVFALSTGVWRRPYGNLPRKSIRFSSYSEVVDGLVYWLADDVEPGFSTCNLIMSFDTTSEEFKEVNLPDSLASLSHPDQMLLISKLRESLIVLETDHIMKVLVVWKMDGVTRSFTKLFTINTGAYAAYIHDFRNSGEPIFEVIKDYDLSDLVVYEPYSKQFVDLGIDGRWLSFYVSPYIETLLLLDQPDLTVYNEEMICFRNWVYLLIKRKSFLLFLIFHRWLIESQKLETLIQTIIYKILVTG